MTKMYSPYEAGVKILERVLELAKAEKNSAHVVEAGIEPKVGLVKKKGFSEEGSESKEHEEGESKEEESAEHEEGSEESSESEAHEQSESPAKEKEEHKEEGSSEEQPKKKMNFFAKKPEMKKSETSVRKSPILEFLAKKEEDKKKSKAKFIIPESKETEEDEVEEDEAKELDKSAIRNRKPTSLKVALRPKKQPVH